MEVDVPPTQSMPSAPAPAENGMHVDNLELESGQSHDPTADMNAMEVDVIHTKPEVGDLETPLPILELLLSKGAMQDDVNYIINEDPLSSLFSYELGQIKPSTRRNNACYHEKEA